MPALHGQPNYDAPAPTNVSRQGSLVKSYHRDSYQSQNPVPAAPPIPHERTSTPKAQQRHVNVELTTISEHHSGQYAEHHHMTSRDGNDWSFYDWAHKYELGNEVVNILQQNGYDKKIALQSYSKDDGRQMGFSLGVASAIYTACAELNPPRARDPSGTNGIVNGHEGKKGAGKEDEKKPHTKLEKAEDFAKEQIKEAMKEVADAAKDEVKDMIKDELKDEEDQLKDEAKGWIRKTLCSCLG